MSDWSFDGFGPRFDEHVHGHLPHYDLMTDVAAQAISYALPPDGSIADLGCSTGNTIAHLAASMPGRRFTAYAYDVDASMIEQTERRLADVETVDLRARQLDLVSDDLVHQDVDVTVILWTLQFLPSATRAHVLRAARARSSRDGLLVVAAKVRLDDARWQEIGDGALAEWKAAHGVTADEILAKSRSLRGTMKLDPTGHLVTDIHQSGWTRPTTLFRWHAWLLLAAWAESVAGEPA
jgi:tRNA (cmo5U34)-methyltransferase